MIGVLVADDQALVRDGLRLILDAESDIETLGEASEGTGAVEQARMLRPDVVLMDVRMPGLDGIAATRRLTDSAPAIRILMLTTFDRSEYVYEALKAGASGFLLKSAPAAELVRAVRVVAAGESLLAPSITRRLIEQYVRRPPPRSGPPPELTELTHREIDVLQLVARGKSNAEIADTLIVGETTIKTHINRIFRKLGLRDRTQAVVLAYETGIVQPGDGAG